MELINEPSKTYPRSKETRPQPNIRPQPTSTTGTPTSTRTQTKSTSLNTSIDFADLDKITEENLGFAAITEGLGFHPKVKRNWGAVRPGNMDDPDLEKYVAPTTTVLSKDERATAIGFTEAGSRVTPQRAIEKPEKMINRESPKDATTNTSVNFSNASPAERSAAMLIDFGIIYGSLFLCFLWNFGLNMHFYRMHWRSAGVYSFVILLTYLLIAESLGGQTFGKMLMGLVVVENDKYRKPIGFQTAYRRLLLFLVSLLPLGFGVLSLIWDSKYLAWHDKLSTSLVTRKQIE